MIPQDLPTLAAVAAVLCLGLAIGFSSILLVLRRQPVLWLWAASLWFGMAGIVLLTLRAQMPPLVSILVGNACEAMACVMMLWGLARHVGRGGAPWLALAVAAAFMLGIAFFSVVHPDLVIRLVLYSVASVAWDLWAIRLLLAGPADIRRSCRLAAAVFALDALLFLARLFLPVAAGAGQDIMGTGLPMVVTYVGGMLLSMAQCFALVLLIVERLMVDLRVLAQVDGLTGLFNRTALLAEGQRRLEQCRRRQRAFSVLVLDLDHFKQINDTWGHQAGDDVLRQAASVLARCLEGRACLLGRYGGEELVVLLPEADLPQAQRLAEVLRAALEQMKVVSGRQRIGVTTSVGVAAMASGEPLETVLARADMALYRAKAAGRNRVATAAHA